MPFTLETVKDYGASGSDALIQGEIDSLSNPRNNIYECLVSTYGQVDGDVIANYYVAGTTLEATGEAQVTSRKAPNGASTNYKHDKYGDYGEHANGLLATAYKKDYNYCLPQDSSDYFIGVAGSAYEADNPQ